MKKWSKIILITLLTASFGLSGCTLSGCGPSQRQQEGPKEEITIDWWGVDYDADYFSRIIERFEDQYRNVKVVYSEKDSATYEQELIDALAANQGPDIAMIKNDWMSKHKGKLAPVTLPEDQKESFEKDFLPVVNDVVLEDDKLYGIPIDIETLGLFYNEDLFEEKRIRKPPATWQEFVSIARSLTKRKNGEIVQAGAAIGTSTNVDYAQDILLAIMLQNGTEITSPDLKSATFHTTANTASGQALYTGRQALEFYTDFASTKKNHYSWNKKQEQAWLAFANDKVGMMFDYYSRREDLLNRNPELDYNFAVLPQIKDAEPEEKRVIARFWFHGVTNNADNHVWAWKLVQELSRQKAYSSKRERTDRNLGEVQGRRAFYAQGYMARTVYKGKSPDEFNQILQNMITNVNNGSHDIRTAIDTGATKITEIYRNSLTTTESNEE